MALSKSLKVLTSAYGVLYVLFILSGQYGDSPHEPLVVHILFVVFLVGYLTVWKNEIYGGLIFVLWWIGTWYLGLSVVEHDRGASVVMGFPLFVIAILFLVSGYRRRRSEG